jgi:quercetin dioxygenase-like cupin family protein
MKIFDLKKMESNENRNKNVFYQVKEFKARIIELPSDGEIPPCEMASYVVFYIIEGTAETTVNNEKAIIREGQCLVTEPATLSMRTKNGVKILGVQIMQQ